MAKREEIPCLLYLYIHSRIDDWAKREDLPIKELLMFMHEWRIPKKLRPLILKEFEMLGLVKRIDNRTLKIEQPLFDMKKVNDYYESLGLFTTE